MKGRLAAHAIATHAGVTKAWQIATVSLAAVAIIGLFPADAKAADLWCLKSNPDATKLERPCKTFVGEGECVTGICGTTSSCTCKCFPNKDACEKAAPPEKAGEIVKLKNPLGTTDIREIVARVIKIFTGVSGSFALLMFVYGGFLWVTSAGNMDKVKQGQKALINASLGLVIIFTAYGIIASIFKVLSGIAL